MTSKACQVEGCLNTYLCKGYCSMHYQRWVKHGDPNVRLVGYNTDPCSKCGVYQRRNDHSWCQPCLNELATVHNNKGRTQRFRRYKLTEDDIYYMWMFQGGRCLVCSERLNINKSKSFHVDHDNDCCSKEKTRNSGTCGECVRGLLCGSCNQGLGNFKDEVQRLKGAIAYLTQMEA